MVMDMNKIKNEYLESGKKETCYGCGACVKFCPGHALVMEADERGFRYPKLDKELCTECGICRKVCPIQMEQDETGMGRLYAVEHRAEEVLKASQSGGMFTALSDYFLKDGGAVYGAVLNEQLEAVHCRAEDAETRDRMHGSKYVQSRLEEGLIGQIEQDLKAGRKVLFTGTPCQCGMVRKNYGAYEKLLTCDFICHGVPSPKTWKDYLEYCSETRGMEIEHAVFRNKPYQKKGWHSESLFTACGKEYVSNEYAALFYSHLAHRSTCFSCQFASQKRYSDITIGGFLDTQLIGFEGRYDVSMCFVNSAKGQEVFECIKDDIHYNECEITYFKNQPCLYHPVECPGEQEDYWKEYLEHGFACAQKKYVTDEIKRRYHLGDWKSYSISNTGGKENVK